MAIHWPFTSEYSKPHSSDAEPETHVDQHSYGADGQKDNSLTVAHITDQNAIDMGQQTYEWHQEQKGK